MALKNYDPKKIQIICGTGASAFFVTGFAKGTFLKAGFINDQVTDEAGASGEVARAISNDHRGMFVVTLMQTSQTNDKFSAMQLLDRATGSGYFPITVKDLLGTTLLFATNAWITKPAEVIYADTIESREWTLHSDELEDFVGGVASAN